MRLLVSLLTVLFGTSTALAHQTMIAAKAYAFDSVPGVANGAAYISLENTGPSEARIVGISGDIAEAVQFHTHVSDGDLRRMVAAELPLVLAPDEVLIMRPGGLHVMLLGLTAPLNIGDTFDLGLEIEGNHARNLTVTVEVFGLESAEVLLGEDPSHEGHDHGTHAHGS